MAIRLLRMADLKLRAKKVGALANYYDAMHDLRIWPDLHKQILDDLENAIKAHEEELEVVKS